MGRLSLRDFHCSGHDRYSALPSYKDFEKRSVSRVDEVIKRDSEGREIWSRTFGGVGGDGASSVQSISDSGYVLADSASSFWCRLI